MLCCLKIAWKNRTIFYTRLWNETISHATFTNVPRITDRAIKATTNNGKQQ